MAFNISVTSTFISESESYEWYDSSGVSLKNVKTYIFFTSIWVDVSDYVRSIRINGSVENLSGEPGANTAFVELDNLDKRFTDINAASPYFGYLSPNKQVKITTTIGAEAVTLFIGRVSPVGFVEQRGGHEGIVTIDVLDDSDKLERTKFDKDYFYQDKKLVDNDDVSNSLLNILLETHGGVQHSLIISNGAVPYTMLYTVFREGESVQDALREIARACLVQYAGYRYDGKYVFDSRLVDGWSEPSSEYTLTAESHCVDIERTVQSLIGNRIKVRGVHDIVQKNVSLWELIKVKEVGTNTRFPKYCWELVAPGEYYLGTDVDPYWAEYEVSSGEVIHVQSTAISQKVMHGAPHTSTAPLVTTGTDLEAEETKGKLVLQNSTATDAYIMNIVIRGTAVIRQKLSKKQIGAGSKTFYADVALWNVLTDDDKEWGLVGIGSNTSSILEYGQTDYIISSEYIQNKTQLDNILQWNLLNGKDPKHQFAVNNLPFLSFLQPGAPISFGLTDLGFSGMATVSAFEHNITPDGADTMLTLLENPGDWIVSTGASIRTVYTAPGGGTAEGDIGAISIAGNLKYYVGAVGCSLAVDIMCDGSADEVEWNEAVQTIVDRGGGTIVGVGGAFVFSSAVAIQSGVTVELDSGATVEKNCDDYAFKCVGTATTHMSNVKLCGSGTITRNAADTNAKELIHFEYVDDFVINDVTVDDSYEDGIYIENCTNGKVEAGVKILDCVGTGLKIIASTVVVATAITITGCGNGYECRPSLATDKISNGDCESTDEPMLDSETTPYLVDCTWERSSTQKYAGSYSYKLTKTSAYDARAFLCDNINNTSDMHGLTAGRACLLTSKIYNYDVDYLRWCIAYYDGSWHILYSQYITTKGEWIDIKYLFTLPESTTGASINLYALGSIGQIAYADEIHVYEFDETDSGCQLVNSSISECTDTGVIVANSHAIIQNNQVTGCTNQGIIVQCGYRNLITNNRAYNNGDDAGLSNENEDNFYDAGSDTQQSGNSWNILPVADEPSLGSPHLHSAEIYNDNPADANIHAIDLSAEIPVGAKLVRGYGYGQASTAGRSIYTYQKDGTTVRSRGILPVANLTSSFEWTAEPDSDGNIYWSASNADVSALILMMEEYNT